MWGMSTPCKESFLLGYNSHASGKGGNPFGKNTNEWYSWNRGYNEFYNSLEYGRNNKTTCPHLK